MHSSKLLYIKSNCDVFLSLNIILIAECLKIRVIVRAGATGVLAVGTH